MGEIEKEDNEGALNNLFQFVQSWLPLAALVLFGFYLYYTLPNQGLNKSSQPDQFIQSSPATSAVPLQSDTTQNQIVAVLTKSIGLQRDGISSRYLDVGAAPQASDLGFSKGMVQLEFMQGATAILEGPVSTCLLYTSPSPRDRQKSRMPSSA